MINFGNNRNTDGMFMIIGLYFLLIMAVVNFTKTISEYVRRQSMRLKPTS